MKKRTDIVALAVIAIIFGAVTCLNLFQPDRQTYSESEKRELATMPSLSVSALKDGSYFQNIESYISDTFFKRDFLVSVSKNIELLFGVTPGGDDNRFVFLGGEQKSETTTAATTAPTTKKPSTISLDQSTVSIEVGGTATVTASLLTGGEAAVEWSVDGTAAAVTDSTGSTAKVTGITAGTSVLTATAADGSVAVCTFTVTQPKIFDAGDAKADFFPSGLFIYGNAVYVESGYVESSSRKYAQVVSDFAAAFPNSRINVVIAPCSSMIVDDPEIVSRITDQSDALDKLGSFMAPEINFVNPYDSLYSHKDEYIYFRSDHHWTARGAYYAYAQFAQSVGLTPAKLNELEYTVISDHYQGSMYTYTKDARVKAFKDTIEAFLPTKPQTMKITYSNGKEATYDSCVLNKISSVYGAFIGGDNPYTVINVPDNPQDFNILVMKDSFGDCMIPFLCQHYGNIIVVDPRHAKFNIVQKLSEYKLDDVMFLNNIQSPNNSSWSDMYLKLLGK